MKQTSLFVALYSVLALISFNLHASTIGPVDTPPGGVVSSSNGVSGANGPAVENYSGLDSSAFGELYIGLNQVDYGTLGAGLSGNADPFGPVTIGGTGTTAIWEHTTVWINPITLASTVVPVRLIIDIIGLGATPWITNLASVGLDDTGAFGELGAVADASSGADFTLTWRILSNTGSGFQQINAISQRPSPPGQTRTSFATGFYYTSPVPVPAAIWLFGSALVGLVGLSRRRKN